MSGNKVIRIDSRKDREYFNRGVSDERTEVQKITKSMLEEMFDAFYIKPEPYKDPFPPHLWDDK